MNEQLKNMTLALLDAGCGQDAIEKAGRLLENGQNKELIRYLRLCRCGLMEDLHKAQRRVDRLDYLIRQAENHS